MERILLNANAVKKNKDLKKLNKTSSKYYGKSNKSVIKSKLCKLVDVSEVKLAKNDTYIINKNNDIPVSSGDLIEKVQAAGLVGMSGSGFSVASKLCTLIASNVPDKTLIVNAVECEPGLVHDEWLIKNRYQEICEGINILRNCLQIQNCIIATKKVSDNNALKERTVDNITIHKVPAKYPMGAERVLIKQILGIELSKSEIPAKSGILVMNVQTVYQLYLACTGNTINGRYVTLANIDKGEAIVSYIEYGTDIKATLVEQFGTCGEFYVGGGLFGAHPLKDVETFTEKISFAAVGHAIEPYSSDKCKSCGRCSMACPMKIKVKKVVKRREKDPHADISGLGAEKCLHCNTCAYVCAAHKNIPEYMED